MGRGLDVFGSGRGLARGGSSRSVGVGASMDATSAEYTEKSYSYDDDMPTQFRSGASSGTAVELHKAAEKKAKSSGTALARPQDVIPPKPIYVSEDVAKKSIASGVRQLDKPRRTPDGRIVQRRIGWQATPKAIVITTAERELKRRDDGKMAPSSPWLIENRKTYSALGGAASKRVGKVAISQTPTSSQDEGTTLIADESRDVSGVDTFPEGASTFSYLPVAVRSSIADKIPSPTNFDGVLLAWQDSSGNTKKYEINLIRMNEDVAIVVQAERGANDGAWNIVQATYNLSEPEVESA